MKECLLHKHPAGFRRGACSAEAKPVIRQARDGRRHLKACRAGAGFTTVVNGVNTPQETPHSTRTDFLKK